MERCTLYSHYPDFQRIVDRVKQAFPKDSCQVTEQEGHKILALEVKGGWFSSTKNLKISYRERRTPSHNLVHIDCPLSQNLAGMQQFVSSIPAANTALQSLLLQKIGTLNAEFTLSASPAFSDEFKNLLLTLSRDFDAIAFAQPGTSFSKAAGQHFLDKNLDLLLDTQGRSDVNNLEVKIDSKYFDQPQEHTAQDQINRKAASENLLKAKGVAVNSHLPFTPPEEEVQLRQKEEVIVRVYALTLIAAKGEGVPLEQLLKVKNGLQINELSPQEELIFNKEELSDQERANATWRYESLNLLQWALGLTGQLVYPAEICNVEQLVKNVIQQSRQDLAQKAKLRSKAEILDELDKTYRMHWACVNARLNGQMPGGGLEPGVVYERHYALNWLTKYQNQDWDDVSTDT